MLSNAWPPSAILSWLVFVIFQWPDRSQTAMLLGQGNFLIIIFEPRPSLATVHYK